MADSQKKIEIDQIPGYAALILISDGDIKLFKAGKRYQEFFALEERHEGKSVLVGLAASERRLLYEQIIGEISRRNDFSYVRKAFSKERGICWLRVKAVYLEEEELGPVYVAVAEDLEDGFSFRRQVISILGSIRKANRELETILNMMDSEVELTAKPRAGKKTPKMHRGG